MIILAIVLLFFVAGVLGGYAGYLQGPPSPDVLTSEKRKFLRFRSIVLGIVGSFLVPVFLTIVRATSGSGDDLVDNLSKETAGVSGWFVLFGFALLAAISSQRLISNLSKKLFDDIIAQANSAERVANETREELNDLEDDLGEVAVKSQDPHEISIQSQQLNESELKVLEAISRLPQRRPTKTQIREMGKFKEEKLDQDLKVLENRGFVRSKEYDGTTGWRLRTAGKVFLAIHQVPGTEDHTVTNGSE